MTITKTSGTNANIDLYRPMMTLYREQATSRSNLKIGYVVKSIITMSKNVVKHFICRNNEIIVHLVVVTLLTFLMSLI